jgi:NADPH:quinone reductase-like Zn-dependent oxidoreductase
VCRKRIPQWHSRTLRQAMHAFRAKRGWASARRNTRRGAKAGPPAVLQGFIDAVRDGAAVVPIGAVYQIDQIVEAHTAMEEGRVAGKIVVLT